MLLGSMGAPSLTSMDFETATAPTRGDHAWKPPGRL